jgi:hypothetical protein
VALALCRRRLDEADPLRLVAVETHKVGEQTRG